MGKENVNLTRRRFLTGLGSAAGVVAAASSGIAPLTTNNALARFEAKSLAKAAADAKLLFGASVSKEIFQDPAYAALYKRHARLLTTDVALKFDYIRWHEGRWDFAEADKLLSFTERNDMQLRGHALVWNENAPKWLKGRSAREITRIFDEHIDKVVSRYAGRLHSWDVVNEPFWPGHDKPGGYRTGPWLEAMGPSYVARAFKRTASVDPDARLVLNEAHCERDDQVGRDIRKGLLRLIDELLDAGVNLHAIGLQGHLQPEKRFSDKAFTNFLWRLYERGLNIYISELDVRDEVYPARASLRDKRVGARYYEFLSAVLQVPSVKAVICWQLSDRYSWLRNLELARNPKARRLPRPLPFDARMQPKPAYDALLRAFSERRV